MLGHIAGKGGPLPDPDSDRALADRVVVGISAARCLVVRVAVAALAAVLPGTVEARFPEFPEGPRRLPGSGGGQEVEDIGGHPTLAPLPLPSAVGSDEVAAPLVFNIKDLHQLALVHPDLVVLHWPVRGNKLSGICRGFFLAYPP